MNTPELIEDDNLGLYQRATESGSSWTAHRPRLAGCETGVESLVESIVIHPL